MDEVGVIAVVGACGPEREAYARRIAQQANRAFFPASRLVGSPDPLEESIVLASWTDPAAGAVVELPDEVPVTELIGAFTDPESRTRLQRLVCVADAAHILDDLHRDEHVALRDAGSGIAALLVARAQLTVTQIEFASAIELVNWSGMPPADLAVVMSLLSHLSPRAHLCLQPGPIEEPEPDEAYTAEQDRAGWMCVLNGVFAPRVMDRRVGTLRYEQVRPLHPGRLVRLLDERIGPGEFGRVIRSAGFCRLATRPGIAAQWEHVGRVISLHPLTADDSLAEDEELLALGQDLAFIGIDLDHAALFAALDEAALTDEEFAAGPEAWAAFADPLPAWASATDRTE